MKFILKEDITEEEIEEESVIDEETKNASLVALLNDTINKEWDELNVLNSTLATMKYEAPEKEDVISILDNIITEKNIHIGMLTKALSLLNPETQELMDAGVEKAEEVISESATTDLDNE